MPGHVVKSTGPDPDPTEYLWVSREMKLKDSSKPYDGKKDCWIPHEKEHFILGKIQGTKGDLITVDAAGLTFNLKKDQVMQVNPPKYEKAEDMSNLTFLNDASVLYNLKVRYVNKLIYTYSGLFCIAVNPYKRFPIYTDRAAKIYIGKRRNEVPPHIFAIAEGAFQGMCQNHDNQSMLITGESGAGKTENTKKVIAYFACVGASTKKAKPGQKQTNLEDQIVQTNPMLEAFGNAKTTRNDNSSRFGKFIRIHFGPSAKLSGADIEQYLLEKARIVSQGKMERGYHIFYEMMSDQIKFIKPLCFLSNNIMDYHFCSQGKVTVESIDDKEDMQFCEDAFTILEFKDQEKMDVYKIVGAVMHFGELKTKMRGRDEQAEPDGTEVGETVGKLLGIDGIEMYKNLCKPKIKVATEFVSQGKSSDQVMYSISAICKSMYDRNFKYLFRNCNRTLETGQKRVQFIGVLDIAGFEIFEFNGFEQICINFTNEKLQQFFNHHMFVLEQEEYKREGIDWIFVDFGMDLQACIELFEKPMGLLAILEEESMFPKATDKSFEEKLNTNLLGASPAFIKAKASKSGAVAHFGICHYAGVVNYTVTGWLEKNKDPLNDTLVEQLKNGSNELIVHLYADHPGQPMEAPEEPKGKGGKAAKKGTVFKTVSSGYRDQLGSLMRTLNATQPHFIRCIVPNETKSPGVMDPHLVMHQLTCNGVLEGIRICRKGFPNRIMYPEFLHRYKILAPHEIKTISNPNDAAKACLDRVGMDAEKYRIGLTKVFFRAGCLGELEETRDDKIAMILTWMQAWIKGWYSRKQYQKLQNQRIALIVIQRNLRKYMKLKNWAWFQMWTKVKPLLSVSRQEDKINAVKDRAIAAINMCKNEKDTRKKLEAEGVALRKENKELGKEVDQTKGNVTHFLDEQNKVIAAKKGLEGQLATEAQKLNHEVEEKSNAMASKRKVEGEVMNIKRDVEDLELVIQKLETEKGNKDHQIRNLSDEISHQDEMINKVNKDKKHLQDCNAKTVDDLQGIEDKANHLTKVKGKLEQTLDELENSIDREKKATAEVVKMKRRVEGDVKLTQETISDLERNQKEIENSIFRKDKEYSSLASRLEDEQQNVAKVAKQTKESHSRIEELEEELEQERQARAKVEKTKNKIVKELDDLTDRLDEAGGATAAQVELNRKREVELAKLRRDLEECNIQQEAALVSLRKKQNDGLAEMAEQLDHLNKNKTRIEKDKDGLKRDTDDAKAAMDGLTREKANVEKSTKSLQLQVNDIQSRFDEANRSLHDFDNAKKKLSVENADLLHQLEEADNQNSIMGKLKTQLSHYLEDSKKVVDEEGKERQTILGKFRNLEHDVDGLQEQLDEESEAKADLQRLLSKSQAEVQMYRSKYESEGIARAEELEASRLKIAARLEEAEQVIENLNFKVSMMDKNKDKLQLEYESMQVETERAQIKVVETDKKQKSFEKVIGDYKMKVDDLTAELDANQRECRQYSTELFRVKAAYDENFDHLELVRKENRNLTDEIKDLMDQIGEGGRSMHEISKTAKHLEMEKEELQAALEEAEAALEQEENKVLRSSLELSQVRQEIDRRIAEKEEEFENTRKSHSRAMESMQNVFENEARGRAEALRMKKKLESDINELEGSLGHTGKANEDLQKCVKKTQSELLMMQNHKEEEQRLSSEYREQYAISERKANALYGELEEARGQLEASDKGGRQCNAELVEANEQVNDLTNINGSLAIAKRKLEGEMQTMHSDMDDVVKEAKKSEEKAKKAMVDAARLADELRSEQEHTHNLEKVKKVLEISYKETMGKLDDVEFNSLKLTKKASGKLEARVKELESQLDDEARRCADSQKNLRKAERRIKELTFMGEEDKKNHERMQENVDKHQLKIKTYKKQIEEAEEIACANLAKFRMAQQNIEIKGL